MKAKIIIVLAAVAMLFSACGKDNELQLENNTLVYDGVTYHFQSRAWLENWGPVVDHYIVTMSQGDGLHEMLVNLAAENLSQTFDLTKTYDNVEFHCDLVLEQGLSLSFTHYDNSYIGCINEPNQHDGTIFSAGTFTSLFDDNGITFTLNGTLTNGKDLAFKVFVPKSEFNPQH